MLNYMRTVADESGIDRLASNSLGARLDAIFSLVALRQQQRPKQRYDSIWDCCCDHGNLGLKMLAAQLCPKLNFVDQVPHIIDDLSKKLTKINLTGLRCAYETHALDAGKIIFPSGERHLVILAGVGGERIIEIMKEIAAQQQNCQPDYLLCPTTTQFDLRQHLSTEHFDLLHEQLVSENNRDYEIILVSQSTPAGQKVSLTGAMWDPSKTNHQRYHNKLTGHYQKQTMSRNIEHAARASKILSCYQECMTNPDSLS